MFKNILAVGIILTICLVPLGLYKQSKAAENSKEKFSQIPVPRLNNPSEGENNKPKDQEFLQKPIGSVYDLSESEFKILQDQALKGAPEPAFRLFLFYNFCKRDYKESNFWIIIAAENGHPTGEYNLAFRLKDDPDPRNRKRARFWLERAAQKGDKDAKEQLKKLNGKIVRDD